MKEATDNPFGWPVMIVISCILCVCFTGACQILTHPSVSLLFYLQEPQYHHRKVRQHSVSHLCIPVLRWDAVCVCVFLFSLMRWKTFHGFVDVDLKLSLSVFLLQNNLFDYKVNHSHPLTPRLNYPTILQWQTAHSRCLCNAFCESHVQTNHCSVSTPPHT